MPELDQPGPEELRWEELSQSLDDFRNRTATMADEFSLAIPQLRKEGSPLPSNWARQYVDWSEQRSQLASDIASRLGVASVSDQSFSDWARAIEQKRDELKSVREREAAEVRSVFQIIRRVQGIQSADAQFNASPEMDQARTLATILMERLGDPATRRVIMDDSGTMKGLRSVLLLIDGTADSEEEEQAVSDVEVMFGRKLSIALLRGRVNAPPLD